MTPEDMQRMGIQEKDYKYASPGQDLRLRGGIYVVIVPEGSVADLSVTRLWPTDGEELFETD